LLNQIYSTFFSELGNECTLPAFGINSLYDYKKNQLENTPNVFKKIPPFIIDYSSKLLSYLPTVSIIIGIARLIFINGFVKNITKHERNVHNVRAIAELLQLNKSLLIIDTIATLSRYVQKNYRLSILK